MNSAHPKLSITIPCYNCEKTLREAVESCYKQGFENENDFEIVMVDDGSKDGTRELFNIPLNLMYGNKPINKTSTTIIIADIICTTQRIFLTISISKFFHNGIIYFICSNFVITN